MDRQTMVAALEQGPIYVSMNDGTTHKVMSAVVDDVAAHVLTDTKDSDGKWRAKILSLVTITSIAPA